MQAETGKDVRVGPVGACHKLHARTVHGLRPTPRCEQPQFSGRPVLRGKRFFAASRDPTVCAPKPEHTSSADQSPDRSRQSGYWPGSIPESAPARYYSRDLQKKSVCLGLIIGGHDLVAEFLIGRRSRDLPVLSVPGARSSSSREEQASRIPLRCSMLFCPAAAASRALTE